MEHHPYNQPFTGTTMVNMDGLMVEVSSRAAREQIARQIASAQAYRRQQQSRIYKPASTGSSPQNLARRRQAAGPRLYTHPSEIHHAVRQRAATSAAATRPQSMFVESRPSSWQTRSGTMTTQEQQIARHSMYEANLHQRNASPYQTIAMNGLPTPITQAQANDVPVDSCFSLDSSPAFQQGYVHMPVSNEWSTDMPNATQLLTPNSNTQSTPAQYPMDYMQGSFDIYQQVMGMSSHGNLAPVGSAVHTAPPTPEDGLPIQKPDVTGQGAGDELFTEGEDNDDGPELIGMGLYDSTPASGSSGSGMVGALNGGSPGSKMLKLCDSWTPPEDTNSEDGEGDDEDEEDDSEQEDEDVEDEDEEDEETEPKEVYEQLQAGSQLPGVDFSSKSFFLDEADTIGAAALAGMNMTNWVPMRSAWTQ